MSQGGAPSAAPGAPTERLISSDDPIPGTTGADVPDISNADLFRLMTAYHADLKGIKADVDALKAAAAPTTRPAGTVPHAFATPTGLGIGPGLFTPQLRPGQAPGLAARPTETPWMPVTPKVRGASGLLVPVTPPHVKANPVSNVGQSEAEETIKHAHHDKTAPASTRAKSGRDSIREADPHATRAKNALWNDCFEIVTGQHPGASDEELMHLTDKMHAEQWLTIRREALTATLVKGPHGPRPSAAHKQGDGAVAVDHFKKRINEAAISRIGKLTHRSYFWWVSEIYGLLAAIPRATEILEGVEHGANYDPSNPHHVTSEYDLQLDLELGGMIGGSVSDECRGYIFNLQSGGEYRGSIFWRELSKTLQRSDPLARANILEEILAERQKADEGVRPYAERMRMRYIQSSAMGFPFSYDEQVLYLLRGLRKYFDSARATIRGFQSQGQKYTFDDALRYLITAELTAASDRQTDQLPTLSRATANAAYSRDAGQQPRRYQLVKSTAAPGTPGHFRGQCFHCKEWGHKAEDCPAQKQSIDRGDAKAAMPSARAAEATEVAPEHDAGNEDDGDSACEGEVIEVIGSDGEIMFARLATAPVQTDTVAANMAWHDSTNALDEIKIADELDEVMRARPASDSVQHERAWARTASMKHAIPAASKAAVTPGGEDFTPEEIEAYMANYIPEKAMKWILDSGATHHMTPRAELLPIRVGAAENAVVQIADGTKAKVTRRGACSATLFGNDGSSVDVILRSVLVVPSFASNLLSVHQLTEEGWSIRFSRTGTELRDPKGNKVETFTEPGTGTPYLMVKTKPTRVINIQGVSRGPTPRASAHMASSEKDASTDAALLWHRRMGHPGFTTLRTLAKNTSFAGKDRCSVADVNKVLTSELVCDPCVEAKATLLPFQLSPNEAEGKMSDAHVDLMGPFEGSKEYKYAMPILDEWSHKAWLFCLPNKEAATVFKVFRAWADLMAAQGHGKLKTIHADHGREFENSLFDEWTRAEGISWAWSAPNTSQQNGTIERYNRTVQERGRAMLHAARLGDGFWPYAFRTACQLINKLPASSIGFRIPDEMWSGQAAVYDDLRVFGSLCWAIKPEKQRHPKLTVRAVRGTYLGPAPEHKAHLVYTPADTPRLRVTRHVIFDESRTYDSRFTLHEKQVHVGDVSDVTKLVAQTRTKAQVNALADIENDAPTDLPVLDWEDDEDDLTGTELPSAVIPGEQKRGSEEDKWPILDNLFGEEEKDEDIVIDEMTGQLHRYTEHHHLPPSVHGIRNSFVSPNLLGSPVALDELDNVWDNTPTKATHEPTVGAQLQLAPEPRRSNRLRNQFKALTAHAELAIATAFGASLLTSADGAPIEPKSLAEAQGREDWPKWEEGMRAEIESLRSMGTWELTDLPPGRKAIGCKWTYKLKTDSDGNAARWKARLVAQGFSQRPGIDFSETFAPVARLTTVRIIIALAIKWGLLIWSMDVVTAFLNGHIKEIVFMRQPPHFDDGTERVCKLLRSLYGLKQSGREWFVVLVNWLKSRGFRALKSEPCVHIKVGKDGEPIIVVLYVDDIMIAAAKQAAIDEIRSAFTQRFKMTDNGPLTQILGLKISINHLSGLATISQSAYILAMARRFGLESANAVDTPMTMALQAIGPRTEGQATKAEITEYASIIGSLMWASQGTRPDIAVRSALSGSRYLKGTAEVGLIYSRGHAPQIEGFTDADHAKDPTTRRSVSGFAFFIHGNLVSWRSRLQPTVAISSTESEYVALSESSREAKWIRVTRLHSISATSA